VYVHNKHVAYTKNTFPWNLIPKVPKAREGGILRSCAFEFISDHPTEMYFQRIASSNKFINELLQAKVYQRIASSNKFIPSDHHEQL